ncbi:MAG: hypothetical protein KAW12_02045 [Candidatus Aminicenantes bacterium]|nr:hypothetical protein [Candidatus Aminicenantes bacterium]
MKIAYFLLVLIIMTGVIALVAYVIKLLNRKKTASAPGIPGGGQTEELTEGGWRGQHQGINYRGGYYRRGRNRPSSLEVVVDCSSPGSFKITKEIWLDRFFKKLGLCCEISTGDEAFDKKFFITTNTVNFTGLFFSSAQKRSLMNEIYDKGFKEISHDGKVMRAKISPFSPGKNFDMNLIREIAALLGQLAKNMPAAPAPRSFDKTGWKAKRIIAFAVPVFLQIIGVIAIFTGLTDYKPLDGFKFALSTLKFSIPIMIIYLWLPMRLLKGRSSSHREFLIVVFISLVAFISAGGGFSMLLNGKLDKAALVDHHTVVVSKDYSIARRGSKIYYFRVNSWREGVDIESFRIPYRDYRKVVPGKTEVTITTKPGWLGYEWLVHYKLHSPRGAGSQ